MKIKTIALLAIFVITLQILRAQIPQGYYDEANGLTGQALRAKLRDIITNGFTSVSYSSLPTHFQTTDKKPNNKVWDMYSDKPGGTPPYEYTFSQQCGNYNSEADCWNREHSIPASWFNDASPMYSDIFHVVPTDGYVNNRRANYPFGKVGSATWTSLNGSKLGNCSFPGYTGTVFEPIDSFKGDFARIVFYMATRYMNQMSNWTGDMFSGGDLAVWAKNMLLQWNLLDPVSAKELARNNTIYYNIQHNRNPFVDHPEWADAIWGSGTSDYNNDFGQPNFIVFPNPADNNACIRFYSNTEQIASVEVVDLLGNVIWVSSHHTQTGINSLDFNIENLAPAIYFIKLTLGNNSSISKFIKQ